MRHVAVPMGIDANQGIGIYDSFKTCAGCFKRSRTEDFHAKALLTQSLDRPGSRFPVDN
jgi:hypothetical protein